MKIASYSFLIIAPLLWLILAFSFWQVKAVPAWLRITTLGIFALGIIGVWFLIRPVDSENVASMADVDKRLHSGDPSLIEFYSEY
jgi:hypothetical protein